MLNLKIKDPLTHSVRTPNSWPNRSVHLVRVSSKPSRCHHLIFHIYLFLSQIYCRVPRIPPSLSTHAVDSVGRLLCHRQPSCHHSTIASRHTSTAPPPPRAIAGAQASRSCLQTLVSVRHLSCHHVVMLLHAPPLLKGLRCRLDGVNRCSHQILQIFPLWKLANSHRRLDCLS